MANFLLGNEVTKIVSVVKKNSKEIQFLSTMSSEQTKLLASLAIVQNDIAQSIENGNLGADGGEYITLKIPLGSDEFTN